VGIGTGPICAPCALTVVCACANRIKIMMPWLVSVEQYLMGGVYGNISQSERPTISGHDVCWSDSYAIVQRVFGL